MSSSVAVVTTLRIRAFVALAVALAVALVAIPGTGSARGGPTPEEADYLARIGVGRSDAAMTAARLADARDVCTMIGAGVGATTIHFAVQKRFGVIGDGEVNRVLDTIRKSGVCDAHR
jgi:hypothetical protein